MKTVALRFSENFAPQEGTIIAHQRVIEKNGFVWYGKLGTPISDKIKIEILSGSKKILLINSGKAERYWAHVEDISREIPYQEHIPDYYRENAQKFKTWFKVTRFEIAPKNIMSFCKVHSSGSTLSQASKYSMSPYFIIDIEE